MDVTVNFPPLHPAQLNIANNDARFRVCAAGRRFGKSMLGSAMCVATALRGKRAWWVAPTFPIATVGWRMVMKLARQIPGAKANQSTLTVQFPNNGEVRVRSADNPDSLRGDSLDFVVLDECAFMKKETWTEALRPALADRLGKALFISTPKGRGWFWDLYRKGEAGEEDWASFQAPTSANPYIAPSEIESARRDLPELIFEQEFLAQFVDMEGAVFRRIQEAATAQELAGPEKGRQYAAGVDVAAAVDYTVVTVMDVQDKRMVYLDRFNRCDYNVLEDRLVALNKRWRLTSMTVETNSIGQPVIDALYAKGLPVIPFTTTSATKQAAITSLQSAFEHGEIKILNNSTLIGELLSFESKRTPSGSFSYSAPDGMHDDCVMSLAFAWQSISGWFFMA